MPPIDTIVAEVRQAREALAIQFNYDLHAMIQDARERQKTSGRKVVSFPPTRLKEANASQDGSVDRDTIRVAIKPAQPLIPRQFVFGDEVE